MNIVYMYSEEIYIYQLMEYHTCGTTQNEI
jgi:hypothetical protein